MPIYFEDGTNVRSNQATIIERGLGGVAYNAVISVTLSDESDSGSGSSSGSDSPSEPVSLTQVKNWCRIDIDDDDALITALITGARMICEQYSNISFISRTVNALIYNGMGRINLPYGPVKGKVTFTDEDGNALTNYSLRCANNCRVNASYSAGYTILPGNLQTALLNQIAWMYENRGSGQAGMKLSDQVRLVLSETAKLILDLVKRTD